MWKYVSGECPVIGQETEIEVEYITVKRIGSECIKAGNFKCSHADLTNGVCSQCPVFYTASTQHP